MILVYFRGYGEWFTRGSRGKKLAIPRITNTPYREHGQPRQIEQDIFLSYDEWRGDFDDSDEIFAEWAHEYERQKENRGSGTSDYLLHGDIFAKPGEYDYHLDGIFYRDEDAKGDVFDTNGLSACGVNYIKCREIDGVFILTEEDEKYFRLTNIDPKTDWVEFSKVVKTLMPCEHPESAFFKEAMSGKLLNDDFDKVEFQIQTQWIRDLYGKSEPILPKDGENNLRFVGMDNINFMPSSNCDFQISNTSTHAIDNFKRGTRTTDYQEIITAALNGMASNYGDQPSPVALIGYIWRESFRHSCIVEKTAKELILVGGKKVGRAEIRKAYQRTTLKKLNKNSNNTQ